jgi:hypothetical protein
MGADRFRLLMHAPLLPPPRQIRKRQTRTALTAWPQAASSAKEGKGM